MRTVSAEEAVAVVQSGNRIFIHSVAAAPRRLVEALTARGSELRVVEIVQLHTEGPAPYAAPELAHAFRVNSVFVGPNLRRAVQDGRADYLPVFLSEVPKLFRLGLLPLDVALVQVSPPDRHGFCSLGVSVDASRAAVQTARAVVAQVNRHMPRTHGDGLIHVDDIDLAVEGDDPLPEIPRVGSARLTSPSAATAPSSWTTAPRFSSGSGPSPTRPWPRSRVTTGWASTPRCSRRGSSTWSRRAS